VFYSKCRAFVALQNFVM